MARTRQSLGRTGEELAARALTERGYRVLERNVRLPGGEIDLVAQDGDCLVFVEVRTRRGQTFGTPEESITAAKQRRLLALAQAYLQKIEDGTSKSDLPFSILHSPSSIPNLPWRIDVVAIEMDERGHLLRLDVIQDAVSA